MIKKCIEYGVIISAVILILGIIGYLYWGINMEYVIFVIIVSGLLSLFSLAELIPKNKIKRKIPYRYFFLMCMYLPFASIVIFCTVMLGYSYEELQQTFPLFKGSYIELFHNKVLMCSIIVFLGPFYFKHLGIYWKQVEKLEYRYNRILRKRKIGLNSH
ncbi:hypothetical protein JP28_03605 [Gallibacterium anatis]|uniref:hypothetical protein n=1 Tax=Gallibacterium anatis TaxID=750 RepID=UPI000530D758|nr:hypothetical protein [Gallibacterium anatis]KGQ44774.1 hypothetical protein JP28_03605 [Gallibacterium anatis]KGQ53180.1 hypothetical protein IO46_03820 [Gallibacterium anatis]KGQ61309.1 hypothetical protein IO45_01375 [Gallibacterium anatis]